MTKELVVRYYRPRDEEAILELLQLVFDGWDQFDLDRTSLDHWRWKYQYNYLKMNLITLGEDKNRIISCENWFFIKIKIDNSVLLCTYSGDLAVHPDFRRKGLIKKMAARSSKRI